MSPLYAVLPSPGEGLGCFSTSLIPAGTRVLVEKPLFAVREPRSNSAVTQAFSQLSSAEQDRYLALYAQDPTNQGDAKVVDIFNSNAWQTEGRTSILPNCARFNHSCIPNASFAWNSRLSSATIHAVVDIPPNTQIYLSYEKPYQNLEERRVKLSSYGFVCSCPACGSDAEVSEIRRTRMAILDGRIRVGRRQKWKADNPKAALELLRLVKEEGLMGEALALAYHDVAVGYVKHGRVDLALRYAAKELELGIRCYGMDSLYVDTTRTFLKELRVDEVGVREQGLD
ncbi:Versicolorin B synthase [Venturia nashicola]|uniref:Versicolorin B synthase n=1 Tax=Venturia nashicola TaxID=86259 RepID=A0A4Z1P6X0_9PEZI|nr:Versicolorin B synthase [Venturia nashicola]TLD36560.1 Versicolorin B synthase [Venturia nashicola]